MASTSPSTSSCGSSSSSSSIPSSPVEKDSVKPTFYPLVTGAGDCYYFYPTHYKVVPVAPPIVPSVPLSYYSAMAFPQPPSPLPMPNYWSHQSQPMLSSARKSPSPPSRHPRLRHKQFIQNQGKPYLVPSPLAGPPHVIAPRYVQHSEHLTSGRQ